MGALFNVYACMVIIGPYMVTVYVAMEEMVIWLAWMNYHFGSFGRVVLGDDKGV